MKKLIAVGLATGILLSGGVVFADPLGEEEAGIVEKYVAKPIGWAIGFSWGVTNVAFRIGKTPIVKAWEFAGSIVGRDPNTANFE